MTKAGAVLAGRIAGEQKELLVLVNRVEEGWKRAKVKQDDYYLDGVALNRHGFYSGLEHILRRLPRLLMRLCHQEPTGIRNYLIK